MPAVDQAGVTPRGGTALIVVPGVGDDAPGDTVGSMAAALLRELGPGARAIPYTRSIVVPPRPGSGDEPGVHDVRCALVLRPGAPRPLMVYEMHWADLSRFPGTVRKFVLTLYGMLFQVSTIGLEALRADAAANRAKRRILLTFSYLVTVLAVGLTAGAAMLGVEFAAMLRIDQERLQVVAFLVTLLAVGGLAFAGDRFLWGRGWRFTGREAGAWRPGWAFAGIALTVGVLPLVLYAAGSSPRMAVHEVLWSCLVRWALPVVWAGVGLAAVAACVVMVHAALATDEVARQRFRATRTAVLSVVVGGLGIALLGALLVAVALGVTSRLAGAGTAVPAAAARDVGAAAPQFGPYAEQVFGQSLLPLGVVLLCAATLLAALVVAAFPYASALGQARMAPAPPRDAAWPLGAAVLGAGAAVALVAQSSPIADAVAVALAAAAIVVAAAWWAYRFRPDEGSAPLRRGFDRLLAYLGGGWHVALLVGALVGSAVALVLAVPVWGPLGSLNESLSTPLDALARLAGGTSTGAATTLALAATVLAGFLASRLPVIAKGLDLAYDVATYMRIPHESTGSSAPVEPPRRRVLRRYAALIAHVEAVQAPDAIVIAAHSQGSMYSIALLMGDPFRDQADRTAAKDWPLAPRLLPDHPNVVREEAPRIGVRLALLTAGCPILQTYAPNFPGQYGWARAQQDVGLALRRIGPDTTWRNVYRSGDFVGRELWDRRAAEGGDRPSPAAPRRRVQEFCLGPGQHTGYWGDQRFAKHVLDLI